MGEPGRPPERVLIRLARAASAGGIDLRGATVRRTSSRWCLSVEHGDYNGTELFGIGVDRFLWCAYRPGEGDRVRLFSEAYPQEGVVEFSLAEVPRPEAARTRGWARFPLGAAFVLSAAGFSLTRGIEGAICSDIPGGGMSRSASLSINLLMSLLEANGYRDIDRFLLAELAQALENRYVGSPCGILDQVMILFAREGMGVHFVPSARRVVHVPLPPQAPRFSLVMMDTGTQRPGLEQSTYRLRRQECERLLALLNERGVTLRTLAEVTPAQYEKIAHDPDIPPALLRRLTYIHRAWARFPTMLEAWRRGDIRTVGAIFREDGIGLRDDYEISGSELEAMCDIARRVPGVLGERMLGGGDKGASGAICLPEAVPALREAVASCYPARFPDLATRWSLSDLAIVDGVRVFEGCYS